MSTAKRAITDLGLFGGQPLFSSARPMGQLDMPGVEDFIAQLRAIYDRRHFSNGGPVVQELERRLAAFHGVKHCIAVANAVIGLTMLVQALGGDEPGEIIMPGFGYRGLPHFAKWAGHKPKFADIDPRTHTLDPVAVRAQINAKTRMILAISSFNTPGHIDELSALAASHGLPLIFDSVDGIASTYKQQPMGRFGQAEAFSLHATKLINGFEGGYVTTDDDAVADMLTRQRDFNHPGADPDTARGPAHLLGLNGKLNEIHAAMALLSLDRIEGVVARNEARFDAYLAALSGTDGVSMLPYLDRETEKRNFRMAIMDVGGEWPLTRDQTLKLLIAEGAAVRPYYDPPLYRISPWQEIATAQDLPATEQLSKHFLHLPVGELTSREDIARIGELLKFVSGNGPVIAARLEAAP